MNLMLRYLSLVRCTGEIDREKKPWSNMDLDYPLHWIIDHLRFDEWENLAPQMIFVSATPSRYEEANAGQVVEQVVRPTGTPRSHY